MKNSNELPLISIVLPVYNGERFLRTSIESCINQTYKNWELLIIDDGSSDNSVLIAQEYAKMDSRIFSYQNPQNLKLPKTLNRGFSFAKGEYLTWTSDDNLYHPQALERMMYLLQNTDAEFVFAECAIIDESGNRISSITAPKDYRSAIWDHNFVGACFLYSRSVYDLVGEYDTNLFLGEDYDYWLRIFSNFSVGYVDEELYQYRRHDKSLSATQKAGQYEAVEKVLLKNFKGNVHCEKLDKFYFYRGLHRSRSLRSIWNGKYKYLPQLLGYKVWHKLVCH